MTVTSARRAANHWPGLHAVPSGPRATISARVAGRVGRRRTGPVTRTRSGCWLTSALPSLAQQLPQLAGVAAAHAELVRPDDHGAAAPLDAELVDVVDSCSAEVQTVLSWLETRMKSAAPQALLVAD